MLLYITCCFQVQKEAARRTEEAADKVEKVNSFDVYSSHIVSYKFHICNCPVHSSICFLVMWCLLAYNMAVPVGVQHGLVSHVSVSERYEGRNFTFWRAL